MHVFPGLPGLRGLDPSPRPARPEPLQFFDPTEEFPCLNDPVEDLLCSTDETAQLVDTVVLCDRGQQVGRYRLRKIDPAVLAVLVGHVVDPQLRLARGRVPDVECMSG